VERLSGTALLGRRLLTRATVRVAHDGVGLGGEARLLEPPVAVRPDLRHGGLARSLYRAFIERMRALGCRELRAITSPRHTASIRFHERLGILVSEPIPSYTGHGQPM
jgi:GNAT superfamily N-acetyltransferase